MRSFLRYNFFSMPERSLRAQRERAYRSHPSKREAGAQQSFTSRSPRVPRNPRTHPERRPAARGVVCGFCRSATVPFDQQINFT